MENYYEKYDETFKQVKKIIVQKIKLEKENPNDPTISELNNQLKQLRDKLFEYKKNIALIEMSERKENNTKGMK